MIFVDSNIVIDLVQDGEWTSWSQRILGSRSQSPMVVNLLVVAEISRTFDSVGDVRVFLDNLGITVVPLTPEVAFRAGRAQIEYRRSSGRHSAILADFLIAGHAATLGAALVTRDRRGFVSYFPELTLITPETEEENG